MRRNQNYVVSLVLLRPLYAEQPAPRKRGRPPAGPHLPLTRCIPFLVEAAGLKDETSRSGKRVGLFAGSSFINAMRCARTHSPRLGPDPYI